MALERIGSTTGDGVAFIVSAGIVYEIIAANCSSPQTTELNASARAKTLMKWVNIGVAQAAVFVLIAAAFEPSRKKPIILGGTLAAGAMYWLYWHARGAGLQNGGTPTEAY